MDGERHVRSGRCTREAATWCRIAVSFVLLSGPVGVGMAQSPPPGWVAYHRAGQLLVPHPPGWRVQDRGEGAFIVYLPGPGPDAQALVYVRPQRFTAQRGIADALGLLPREEAELFPGARIQRASVLGPEQLPAPLQGVVGELVFSVGGQPFVGSAFVWGSPAGGALAVISATPSAWQAEAETMRQILQNFRYLPASGASSHPAARAAANAMVTWSDPNEGAFALPVPQGWQVAGGMIRPNAILYKPEVVVTSPDGSIQVRIGDAMIPTYGEPMTVPGSGQMPEGTIGAGGVVGMHYRPGYMFLAQLYLPFRFGAVDDLQVQDLPDLAERAFRLRPPAAPLQGRADAGAVSFTVATPAGPRRAWFLVVTRLEAAPGLNAAWYIGLADIMGYVCAPAQEMQARAVLGEMARGFRWNPRWLESQFRSDARTAHSVQQYNQEMGEIYAGIAAGRAAGMAAAQEPLTRTPLGIVELHDDTGQTIRVQQNGSQYYYLENDTGEVFATDAADLPPFDYTQLFR
jgi:hypothetical protein